MVKVKFLSTLCPDYVLHLLCHKLISLDNQKSDYDDDANLIGAFRVPLPELLNTVEYTDV